MTRENFPSFLRTAVPGMSERVEGAFRQVDRADFVPAGVDPYRVDGTVTLIERDGQVASSVSAPNVVARMLDQLDVRPGRRVLEVGTASGFNAALLEALGGHVTSIEVLAELVAPARERLRAIGSRVSVHVGDGMVGWPGGAPYDRVEFTCSAAALPAWVWDQTTADARVVIPIRWGTGASWALDREGDEFVCRQADPCGFVPLVGEGPRSEVEVLPGWIHRGRGEPMVLDGTVEPQVTWTGATVDLLPVVGLSLWLWQHPTAGHLSGRPEGLPRPLVTWACPCLVDGGLAYVTVRKDADGHFEAGVCSVGASPAIVDDLVGAVRSWVAAPDGWPAIRLPRPES